MPKQKTHKATAKVLKKHKSGLITYKKSGGNHQTADGNRRGDVHDDRVQRYGQNRGGA